MANDKVQLTTATRATGSCHFEKNGTTIKQVVDKMFNGQSISLEKDGKQITILQSGHLGCTNGKCAHNKLWGEPAEESPNGYKKSEFRYCKLLEIDPEAAMSLNSHVRGVELEKMIAKRDATLPEMHEGWEHLKKYTVELAEIAASEKK